MLQPDTQGHRSYRESFTRRRNLTPEVLTRENLLTDRGAYLNFLEVQLERVSAACLAAQDVSAKIEVVAGQTSAVDEKVRTRGRQGEIQLDCSDVFAKWHYTSRLDIRYEQRATKHLPRRRLATCLNEAASSRANARF